MQSLDRFRIRVKEDWLPSYCSAPNRRYDQSGFRPSSIKVEGVDAEDCMRAIDDAVVFCAGPGMFRAARSSAIELLFWEGKKSISPRPITLWLEPVITFAALARLHHTYGWPKECLGTQSRGWGFDIVAFGPDSEDAPRILGEVKKTRSELEDLRLDLLALSQGTATNSVRTNSSRKWNELLGTRARLLWLVGPGGVHHIFHVVRGNATVQLVEADDRALGYSAA